MPAATGFAATATFAAVDGEAATDRLTRDFFLMDGVGVGFFDVAAAVGAGVGKFGVENLVDGRRIGRRPMSMFAVLIAGFAAWLFGPFLGRPFGEGGGLSFRGAFEDFDPSQEFGDSFLEFDAAGTALTGEDIHVVQRSRPPSPQLRGFSRYGPASAYGSAKQVPTNKH
jgi:hypothetical protein